MGGTFLHFPDMAKLYKKQVGKKENRLSKPIGGWQARIKEREREKRSKISTTADISLAKMKRSRACFSLYVLYTTTYYILLRQYYDYRLLDLHRLFSLYV
jgi:hypothetical protein